MKVNEVFSRFCFFLTGAVSISFLLLTFSREKSAAFPSVKQLTKKLNIFSLLYTMSKKEHKETSFNEAFLLSPDMMDDASQPMSFREPMEVKETFPEYFISDSQMLDGAC